MGSFDEIWDIFHIELGTSIQGYLITSNSEIDAVVIKNLCFRPVFSL